MSRVESLKQLIKKNWFVNICLFVFFLVFYLIMYWYTISTTDIIVRGDGMGYFLSKYLWADAVRQGELPLWNPYVAMGNPFHADTQNTIFNPINLLLLFLNPVIYSNLFHVIQLSCAGFFMYLYINKLFSRKSVAFVTGFIFSFSVVLGGVRIEHTPIISTVVFYPLILYFLECFKDEQEGIKYLIYSAMAMTLQFFCGFTQMAFYFAIVCFVYLIYVCCVKKLGYKKTISYIIMWGILYALLCAVQLIPLLQIIIQSGRMKVPYESFSSLSYDLRILLKMIFPLIYTDNMEAFGPYQSSGVDIEIYIGIICLMLAVYTVVRYYKNKFVQLIIGLASGAFLFGMACNVPLLGKILFKIPVISSFRVNARVLSIFTFFCIVLFAFALNEIIKYDELYALCKMSIIFFIAILLCGWGIYAVKSQFDQQIFGNYYANFKRLVLPELIITFSVCIALFLALKLFKYKWVNYILLFFVCIITIFDVYRFSTIEGKFYSLEYEMMNSDDAQVDKLFAEDTNNLYRSFVTIDTFDDLTEKGYNSAKSNKNIYSQYLLFNNYLTFLDWGLKNYNINDTAIFPSTVKKLTARNDLISMMSLHYIFDVSPTATIPEEIVGDEVSKLLFELKSLDIECNNDTFVLSEAVVLEKNSSYKVSYDIEYSVMPATLYVDFYNGANYDYKLNQTLHGNDLTDGKYVGIINTGESALEDIVFRVLADGSGKVQINNLKIEKMKLQPAYRRAYESGTTIVYENLNAKQLLYVPEKLKSIESFKTLYDGENEERVDKCSYVLEDIQEKELTGKNTVIKNLELKYNSIKANVISEEDTFINHTQMYYPGWKAYVDGKKVQIYNVNGLIQGMEVPAGEHKIEFRYSPFSFKAGLALSLMGIFISIYLIHYKKPKQLA